MEERNPYPILIGKFIGDNFVEKNFFALFTRFQKPYSEETLHSHVNCSANHNSQNP